jgi:rubrerythrin
MSIYTPYTYLIGWSKLNKWYYGVRFAKKSKCLYETGCHPDDLWKTYYTSSDSVASFIEKNGEPDVVSVRRKFETADEARHWEMRVLLKLDVKNKDMWLNSRPYTPYNMGGWKWSEDSKNRIRKPKSKEHAKNISRGRKGIIFTDSHIENIRKATTGIEQSEETKKRRSDTMSKLKWWNDGSSNVRSIIPPGSEWREGRCGSYTQKTSKVCPHCGKIGKGGGMTMWHFDNCNQR